MTALHSPLTGPHTRRLTALSLITWCTLFCSSAAAPPSATPAGGADQVHPELRVRRLGQLYDELQALLKEHRTTVSVFNAIDKPLNKAMAALAEKPKQLQQVRQAINALAAAADALKAFPANLPRLRTQEATLQQEIAAAQRTFVELKPQWAAAKQRLDQVSPAIEADLPKRREEWLWLCDPLGKLGAKAHRDSIEVFSKQIAEDREFALSYLGRGFDYLHTQQYTKALDDFAKVLKVDNELADVAAAGRGWTYARMQNNTLADAEFKKATKAKARTQVVALVLGHKHAEGRKDTLAEGHFRRAANIGKHVPPAREALAFFLATRRADDPICAKQAIQHATEACKMTDWDQWLYLDTLAVACAAAGDFELANQWGKRALQRAPREYQKDLQERLDLYAAKRPYRSK